MGALFPGEAEVAREHAHSAVWGSTPTLQAQSWDAAQERGGRSHGKVREGKGWGTEPWREGTVFKEPKKGRKRQCVF